MPGKIIIPAPLHQQLIDGFPVKSRPNGTVHTLKDANGATVAEVCCGKSKTRLNFRVAPNRLPKNIELGGKSKSWPGGGVNVVESNLTACRAAIASVVEVKKAATAAEAAASSESAAKKTTAAVKRVRAAVKPATGVKVSA